MRRLVFLMASLVVFAAACSSAELVRERSVRLDAVIVGEDGDAGRQLTVLFVGGPPGLIEDDPCAGEYEVEIAESGDEVSLTLFALALADTDDDLTCTAEGHFRQLDVELVEPIGDRAVIDGHDDSQQWVIDPAAVLWPQSLAAEWIVRRRDAGNGRLISRYGPPTTSDDSITLVAGPIDTGSAWTLDAARNESATVVRQIAMRGSDNAAEITSDESGVVTIAFDEAGLHYRASANGETAIAALDAFVVDLGLDQKNRTFEIPFTAPIAPATDEGTVIPTPTATRPAAPAAEGPGTPTAIGAEADGQPSRDLTWTASESTRDVANYLQALRHGAYEQAAWPAANNGVVFDGQAADETGAEYLERACGVDLCQGPYLVRGEPGYIDPTTAQALAFVSVMHIASGEETTMLLLTFEGQRMITSLPPLVASENNASLRDSLFGDAVPQRVVVERFDAFEIWDGPATEWVTNWYAEVVTQIEGDVVATWFGLFGLHDPQLEFAECARIAERDGQVLAVDQCVTDQWAVSNAVTGRAMEPPVPFELGGETELAWFGERGGAVVTGFHDAEGNLVSLRSIDGVDLLGDDYASLAVLSTDGRHIAYVDHSDPAAFSHFWSPVVVVRDAATGGEVGRWTLDGAVSCLEYAVDWVVACEVDNTTIGAGIAEQTALTAINPATGELNRVETATQIFLPTG